MLQFFFQAVFLRVKVPMAGKLANSINKSVEVLNSLEFTSYSKTCLRNVVMFPVKGLKFVLKYLESEHSLSYSCTIFSFGLLLLY